MFRSIDRPSFSAIQSHLFPIYFSLQTALPAVLALTFPGNTLLGVHSGISGLLHASSRWDSFVPIMSMFATGLVNLAVLLPATMKIMKERRGQGMAHVFPHLHISADPRLQSNETARSGTLRVRTRRRCEP